MSSYKKVATRVLVLGALMVGAWSLAHPTPAYAFTCLEDCQASWQNCVSGGLQGCDEIYFTCANNC
jgi:hypothetical protein